MACSQIVPRDLSRTYVGVCSSMSSQAMPTVGAALLTNTLVCPSLSRNRNRISFAQASSIGDGRSGSVVLDEAALFPPIVMTEAGCRLRSVALRLSNPLPLASFPSA